MKTSFFAGILLGLSTTVLAHASTCFSDAHTVDALPATNDSSQIAATYSGAGMSAADATFAKRVIPYLTQISGYQFNLTAWSRIPGTTLKDHLFTASDLKLLWVTFDILPAKYRAMQTLRTIMREPNYYTVDEGAAEYQPSSGGSIVYSYNLFEPPYAAPVKFYDVMQIHELTHALDENFRRSTGKYLSSDPRWVALFNQGIFVPTENASLDPAEDLADSAAYFMIYPDKLKSIAPGKFDFLASMIFDGKTYDTPTLQAQYAAEIQNRAAGETEDQAKDRIRVREYRGCEVLGN